MKYVENTSYHAHDPPLISSWFHTNVNSRENCEAYTGRLRRKAGNMGAHNYSYVFQFEKDWDSAKFNNYMKAHWSDSILYSIVYVSVVFGVQMFMKNRPRYDLRPCLTTWSGILAVFSIFGAVRTLPELITSVRDYGFEYSICVPSYFEGVTSIWCVLFVVSKVYELGDTLFIVLRKQELIFLHWYHHVTVMLYVWYSYPEHTAIGRWFMTMNYIVHAFMYTYYALRAARISIPKFVNMVITAMQISQMLIGCYVSYEAYQVKKRGGYCQQTYKHIQYGMIMYFSYFLLFAHFFYSSYLAKLDAKKKQR